MATLTFFALILTTALLNHDGNEMTARSTTINLPEETNSFAYVFYATEEHYACSALINVQILQATEGTHAKDYVLIHTPAVSERMIRLFHALSVKTTQLEPIRSNSSNGYYSQVLTKMYIFNMTQYQRIIFLDSDILVMKNLDHLFDLPSVDIAAPRAYWLAQPFITSLLLVVEPSPRVVDRIAKYVRHPSADMFDMDIINKEFVNESLILPNDYGRLNSEWDLSNGIHKFDYAMSLDEMYDRALVIQFSDLGKPWSFTRDAVKRLRPNATPQFYALFERWNELAWMLTCGPAGRFIDSVTDASSEVVTEDDGYEDEDDEVIVSDSEE